MDTIDKILQLMDSHGVTAAKLTKEAGITNGLITQWKSHKQKPSMKNLIKIANYFGISMDYFLDNEQKNKLSSEEESFSQNKKELMALFDTMSDAQQESFLVIARAAAHELSLKDKHK